MEGRFLLLLCTMAFIGSCEAGDRGNTLNAGQTLQTGDYLKSSNANYQFLMQPDCNLVLYKLSANAKVLWKSGSNDKGSRCQLRMQTDDNLVIYNDGNAVWSSNTYLYSTSSRLVMQDDGNVVIYTPSNKPVWAIGTSGQ